MKAHVGVDAASGLVHTLIGTAGNVADVTQAGALLHSDETAALGEAGYQGVEKRPENEGKSVTWHVARKRSKRKALPNNKHGRMQEKLEQLKASVRAKVEHPFHVLKNMFRALSRLGEVGIPVYRDRSFRSIVTTHSGLSWPISATTGISGHDAGISGHDTGMASHSAEMMLRI